MFPGGEWVDEPHEKEAEVVEVAGRDPVGRGFESLPSLSLTVIGGANDALRVLLTERAPARVILGTTFNGRGGEAAAAKLAEELGIEVETIRPDADLFGAKAADVNVEQVLGADFASPLVLVGKGVRVKQARGWLARARWPREVVEL